MVFTLVYLSTMRQLMTTPDLDNLLVECRTNNRALDVTGLLVYRHGQVMQLLEGEEHTVRDLYSRIAADPRHHGLLVVWTSTTDHRRFPDWTMGYDDDPNQPSPPEPVIRRQSQQQLANLYGSAAQQHYAHRRATALQNALAEGGLIRTLAVVVHGHDPEILTHPDGTTQLCCRECRHRGTNIPFPCPAARTALNELENSATRRSQP